MTKYLVAVEHPTGFEGENITVTNDVEGFGPGLLAAYPIQTIEADSPAGAAYCYAKRHGLTNMLIVINLPGICEEWWIHTNEAHKIDSSVVTIWEPDRDLPGKLNEFLTRVTTQFRDIKRDGGSFVDAIADILASEGYVVVRSEIWQNLRNEADNRHASAAEDSPPLALPGEELFTVFITNKEILSWEVWDDETVFSMLTGEAYGRWLITEPDRARAHEHHREGHVAVKPGGFLVWLEAKKT